MNLQKNVLLKNYTSYRIGGPASFFAELKSLEDLHSFDFSKFSKIFVLGGGTNVLVTDNGFDGLVIRNIIKGVELKEDKLYLGSGESMEDILNFCIENGLSGLEWAGGLPGTIGGAVRGNAGAFGGETKDSVLEVRSVDLKTHKKFHRENKECNFGYRWSVFKENTNELITSVVLKLQKGDREEIQKTIKEKIDYRNLKHPMDHLNIGSTFKNISLSLINDDLRNEFAPFIKNDPFPLVLTTKLLALAGLKGKKSGDAQISEKHPNFIVNLGNAKASEILKLVQLSKKTVKDKWGIKLEEEIQILA